MFHVELKWAYVWQDKPADNSQEKWYNLFADLDPLSGGCTTSEKNREKPATDESC